MSERELAAGEAVHDVALRCRGAAEAEGVALDDEDPLEQRLVGVCEDLYLQLVDSLIEASTTGR